MRVYENGTYRDMTEEELANREPTPSIPYEQRVVNRIRERYSVDDELALHRKANIAISNGEKPSAEFIEYNLFVETIKTEEKWKTV